LADWERNDDDTYTFYGYGRVIQDKQLQGMLADLVAGVPIKQVAKERRLPPKAVKEIWDFFYEKMMDE
jgi:hypothetical protein